MKRTWVMFSIVISLAYTVMGQEIKQNDPLNAVVKIECIKSTPNYFIPWQNKVQGQYSGSGVVIVGNRILTNAHNVADSSFVSIRKNNDDALYTAKIEFVDHECDLALLTIEDKKFFADITPFELGATPPPQTQVLAVGFPLGGESISVTQGIISRIEVRRYSHSMKYLLTAQLDAAINPGSSGGPIFFDGKVVGIAFQGDRRGENLGYMIPNEVIQHFLTDIKDGKVDGFGILGFQHVTLDNPDTRRFLKMKPDQTGILIGDVNKSTPKDSIQNNDVLLAIDENIVANNGNIRLKNGEPRHFATIIMDKQIGENVRLTLLRNGEIISVSMPVRKFGEQILPRRYDQLPDYYTIGGLVFTNLSYSFLDEWEDGAGPPKLLAKSGKEKIDPEEEIVLIAMILGDEVNVGYQGFISTQIHKVNGEKVRNLRKLIAIVENCTDEFITFALDDDLPMTLDLKKIREATPQILDRYRVPADRSATMKK